MNSKKADQQQMEDLHGQLVEVLAAAIHEKEPKVVDLPDAEAPGGKVKATVMVRNAAILNVARQLLKDNGIQADLNKSPAGRSLLAGLPFAGTEDDQDGTTI
jgi:hypothetical protein